MRRRSSSGEKRAIHGGRPEVPRLLQLALITRTRGAKDAIPEGDSALTEGHDRDGKGTNYDKLALAGRFPFSLLLFDSASGRRVASEHVKKTKEGRGKLPREQLH
jgi:hypothetical protein